jgi:uncharacterized membrane protein YhaH (DUF805 family)
MQAANPYAAPEATVRDVMEEEVMFQPVKIFSPQGRVGRLRFVAYGIAAYLLVMLVGGIGGFVGAATKSDILGTVILWGGLAAYFVYLILITIQRSHDMDWSGWTGIAAFIPFVGLIWLFKGGTPGVNRFGAPPPPNTLGVKILAWILPVIAIIGIVAAIAIPAYSGYAKRAQSVQQK